MSDKLRTKAYIGIHNSGSDFVAIDAEARKSLKVNKDEELEIYIKNRKKKVRGIKAIKIFRKVHKLPKDVVEVTEDVVKRSPILFISNVDANKLNLSVGDSVEVVSKVSSYISRFKKIPDSKPLRVKQHVG